MKRKETSSSRHFQSSKSRGTEFERRVPSDSPPPSLRLKGDEEFSTIYSLDVNLTIRLRVQEFTRKQATLLAGQALFLVLHEGITLQDWMVLEFLYSYLLGQKQEPLSVKNPKELELLLLLKIVLLSGTWIGLEGKSKLPQDVQTLLRSSQWIPNIRTFQSRKVLFSLNKYLEVRIVPIDALLERSKGTTRYSSYCKGYGEGSSMARQTRTRPSAELDGEEVNLEEEQSINYPLNKISTLLDLVMYELKYSNRKRK